ncbi:hypothetical protein [Jeotgalibaca porci]|uniref:hypothetical protein n=1 Tax=Jeotgalibaca porci TaxID=1868793 RepID=UPI00359FE8C0
MRRKSDEIVESVHEKYSILKKKDLNAANYFLLAAHMLVNSYSKTSFGEYQVSQDLDSGDLIFTARFK